MLCKKVECKACKGSGWDNGNQPLCFPCTKCDDGYVYQPVSCKSCKYRDDILKDFCNKHDIDVAEYLACEEWEADNEV